jgi:glycosyltransferase-like protein LARGE
MVRYWSPRHAYYVVVAGIAASVTIQLHLLSTLNKQTETKGWPEQLASFRSGRDRKSSTARLLSIESLRNYSAYSDTHFVDWSGIDVINHYKSDIRNVVSDSITLVSQMSVDETKIQRLLDLASRWTGCISIAIYFQPDPSGPGPQTMEQAMQFVDDIRAKNAVLLRKVQFHLVFDGRPKNRRLHYPNNYLRNVAFFNVMTDFLFILDVDLIPSLDSHDLLHRHFKTTPELVQNEFAVLVLPAFEGNQSDKKWQLAWVNEIPSTKSELMQHMRDHPGVLDQFEKFFDPGQGPSNYTRWYTALQPYPVEYQHSYEPYFVIRRSPAVPPFWEHFDGFGKNKITWVEEIAAKGFHFYVSPDAFITHMYHDYTKQEARILRPFIIDEYTKRFQLYLKKTYGTSFWEDDALSDWYERQKMRCITNVYRFCQNATIHLGDAHDPLFLGYRCGGLAYHATFIPAMRSLAFQLPEPIGRRNIPISPNATVLVIGNSHTRQMIQTMVCHFKEQVVEYDPVMVFDSARTDTFMVRFENNSTLISLTDNPVVYSPHWVSIVEAIAGRQLKSFDAVVFGRLENVPELVAFANSTAPTLRDVTKEYDGPVVVVSEFGVQGKSVLEDGIKLMEEFREHRDNISVIDGRKYIKKLQLECATEAYSSMGRCLEIIDKTLADRMHRCVGREGGHADLIAWEITEKLNDL